MEGSSRMRRIDVRDPEDSSGRNGLPVRRREGESVIRSGVQRIGLQIYSYHYFIQKGHILQNDDPSNGIR